MLFPPVSHDDTFEALRQDPRWVDRIVRWFQEELGLRDPGGPSPGGSVLVVRYGPVVLKLFPPTDQAHAETEATILQRLRGNLPTETPELIARGEQEGWPWVLMSTLPGEDLSDRWPGLSRSDRRSLARQLGETLRALHGQPPPGQLVVSWPVWAAAQRSSAIDQHRRGGCPPQLLEQLPGYLQDADLSVGERGLALLHTEVMREHLKVRRVGERWRLCGLFDFEPAMVAPVDYEFASVGLFFSSGDPVLLRDVLAGWGVHAPGEQLTHRLFALALIHRYANLALWMRRTGFQHTDLRVLATHWFGLGSTLI